ncbi:MAG: hypothetical protein E7190_13040 [Erysipelotrichaceae bacterium]|nr:hypothetical protein [Erysipelotrichaceae bacterium]
MTLEFIIVFSLIAVTAVTYYAIRRMCDLIDPENAADPLKKQEPAGQEEETSERNNHFPFSFHGRPLS